MELTQKEIYHLEWIYARMIHVHKENDHYDFMHAFKKILNKLTETKQMKTILYNGTKFPIRTFRVRQSNGTEITVTVSNQDLQDAINANNTEVMRVPDIAALFFVTNEQFEDTGIGLINRINPQWEYLWHKPTREQILEHHGMGDNETAEQIYDRHEKNLKKPPPRIEIVYNVIMDSERVQSKIDATHLANDILRALDEHYTNFEKYITESMKQRGHDGC
jgi:hypothetical protein